MMIVKKKEKKKREKCFLVKYCVNKVLVNDNCISL